MMTILKNLWATVASAFGSPPKRQQVAALCYRGKGARKEVLLITSRDTGRWIIPKGWPMRGKDGPGSAMQEAWEEAGVRKATYAGDPIGCYTYEKRKADGVSFPVETTVYPVSVEKLENKFPEVKQRKRAWYRPKEAAKLVNEPELQSILRAF